MIFFLLLFALLSIAMADDWKNGLTLEQLEIIKTLPIKNKYSTYYLFVDRRIRGVGAHADVQSVRTCPLESVIVLFGPGYNGRNHYDFGH